MRRTSLPSDAGDGVLMRDAQTREVEGAASGAGADAASGGPSGGRAELEPFAVCGLAFGCVLLAHVVFGEALGFRGERYEWALYLTLGTAFPLLLLALSAAHPPRGIRRGGEIALSALLGAGCAVLLALQATWPVAVAALAQWGLTEHRLGRTQGQRPAPVALVCLVATMVAWTAAAQFLWWASLGEWLAPSPMPSRTQWLEARGYSADLAGYLLSAYRILVFAGAFALVLTRVCPRRDEIAAPGAGRRSSGPAIALAVLVLALFSVRADTLFDPLAFHHWAVLIGPAEMVRQGGWLYWDVPSQYGFLSTLAIAAFPAASVWQSFYLLNASLLFLSALFLFLLFRSMGRGVLQDILALLVSVAAVFLMSGYSDRIVGPQALPSGGSFRFFWCYALLTLLVWQARRPPAAFDRRALWTGNALWLLATLWSSESAVFAAAIWFPAYGILVWHGARWRADLRGGAADGLRAAVPWLAAPPALLAGSVGAIWAYYVARLGHAPDWNAFLEYSRAFSSGFFALPMDPGGPGLTLFLVLCIVAVAVAHHFRCGPPQVLALVVAAWFALWATISYFVSRSHPNNATTLSPLLCAAVGVVLLVAQRSRAREGWADLIRTCSVPVLTVIVAGTFGNATGLVRYAVSPHAWYQPEVARLLPVIDPSLQSLLRMAGVQTSDPIVLNSLQLVTHELTTDDALYGNLLPAWPVDRGGRQRGIVSPPRAWLPAVPFALLAPLPDARRQEYMARFVKRAAIGGWLVQHTSGTPYTRVPWLREQLLRTHRPARIVQNPDWELIWFELRRPPATGANAGSRRPHGGGPSFTWMEPESRKLWDQ